MIFKRRPKEIRRKTLHLKKDRAQLIEECLKWNDETMTLPRLTISRHESSIWHDMFSIRLDMVSREDGFYIRPMLMEGSDNLPEPNVLLTLPERKELLGLYQFESRGKIFELQVEIE